MRKEEPGYVVEKDNRESEEEICQREIKRR